MYLRGSVLIIICQKTHCCVKRFFRKTDPDSKKVSQIKTRLRKVPTTKISLHFADTSTWVAFYWSFESAHKSSWLKLDERSRSVSHQNPVKHPVGGIKIDLPVTLALTLWPWPSTDQWFKCAKVQIIACAVWRRTLVWTSRDWIERFCFANPNLLQGMIKQDLRDAGDAFHGKLQTHHNLWAQWDGETCESRAKNVLLSCLSLENESSYQPEIYLTSHET